MAPPDAASAAPVGRQRIARVRRQYNQWVADQTREDYALRFTAKKARRWSAFRVANTALGAISFLACESIGAGLTLDYGFSNAVAAIIAVGILIFFAGLPIAYYGARHGVDIDLLTRGAGFGYIGSTITSLIYASFTFLLFSVEAAIMAMALQLCFGIPPWLGYIVSALVTIPIVTYGIRAISRLQLWTQPIWLVLQFVPVLYIGYRSLDTLSAWRHYPGNFGDGSFNLMLFGTAAAILLSFLPQIGEQVDYLRFLPPPEPGRRRWRWWLGLLPAGPGWIVLGAMKLLAGSFLAVLALRQGVPPEAAADPTHMYHLALQYLASSPQVTLFITGLFVITCQLKINVTNTYAGSIAWSNFFSRLTHSHPGRVIWVVFNATLALMLMELGVFAVIGKILEFYSNFAVAWIGALVADLVINKPLGFSPPYVEFKRAHLYDVNPVGTGAMGLSVAISTIAFFGLMGEMAQAMAPFIGFFTAFAAAPVIAWATKGKYYIAREPARFPGDPAEIRCCICENTYEREDMSHCPAYAGPICSLCCTLDARCHDLCKPQGRIEAQLKSVLTATLPRRAVQILDTRVGQFAGLLTLFALTIGGTLLVIGQQSAAQGVGRDVLDSTLWSVFFSLFIMSGIAAWLLVLALESRRVAEEESARQNQMLTTEIEAHERTDAALQKAKEAAEAANLAKSRYVVGMSHEIRAPLNAIFGYAQLLERDPAIPNHRRDAVRVIRRGSEHLSNLVDGLLDISKIEAGRLYLYRDRIPLKDFLGQIVDMFRLQAAAKGIAFRYEPPANLPEIVYADEKRLRQILINLLSNAIKYTEHGHAALRLTYRSQVAEFLIEDSGIGIPPEDLERIFQPFERGSAPAAQSVAGTGLGLTITKLLTEVMGGAISVESRQGMGSTFHVRLFLSEAQPSEPSPPKKETIRGYLGPRRTVLVADDDAVHVDLIRDLLEPLGFALATAQDGLSCLAEAEARPPDLALLDISMPGMSGWEVARRLREAGHDETRIVMVSANVDEAQLGGAPGDDHDAFVVKPIDMRRLLDQIRLLLRLDWVFETAEAAAPPIAAPAEAAALLWVPERRHLEELIQLGRIGYVRGIEAKLNALESDEGFEAAAFVAELRGHVRSFDLKRYLTILEGLTADEP
jgi:signal transduction histidine kinase/CheY-like chemotaxis protein